MNHHTTLEFDQILQQLAYHALSDKTKQRCLNLVPSLNESEVKRRIDETTQAKRVIEQVGTPPIPSMADLQKVISMISIDAMLVPEQITCIALFLASCRRMKTYLKKAEMTDTDIAWYGAALDELPELENEIEQTIRNGIVDDKASASLSAIRRQISITTDRIKEKLNALLRNNKSWFSESFVSERNGHYTLPVKRECRKHVTGIVIDTSQTGGTCFIEPASVGKLQTELAELQIEEENEVRRILYTLTALISDDLPTITRNIDTLETLDFLFAKAKLSLSMNGEPIAINRTKEICLINAKHPLLDPATAVPLNFAIGLDSIGVVITGPNTGGKTVALKTVGLLSLMIQSGLHIPADKQSSICMRNLVLCDIGDGQSITENLSTFSSHMKNIIEILDQANHESLVLLDELGSGTDPTEGMGIAVAVLDELCAKQCLFVITSHYPEIKDYAEANPNLVNARMAFDKESLLPLYRLEIGRAGESCALYIAKKLGMQPHILARAHKAAYGEPTSSSTVNPATNSSSSSKINLASNPKIDSAATDYFEQLPISMPPAQSSTATPRVEYQKMDAAQKSEKQRRSDTFQIGDSVLVFPQKEIGIVYARSNHKGEIGVQVKGDKKLINHKRIKLHIPADELYPDDYDLSIVFDTVENRKANKRMQKRHEKGNEIINRLEE